MPKNGSNTIAHLDEDSEKHARELISIRTSRSHSDFRQSIRTLWSKSTDQQRFGGYLNTQLESMVDAEVQKRLRIVNEVVCSTLNESQNTSATLIFNDLAPPALTVQGDIYKALSEHGVPIGPGITWAIDNAYRQRVEESRAELSLKGSKQGRTPVDVPETYSVAGIDAKALDFTAIAASEIALSTHLQLLWNESILAKQAGAHLAAIILFGSLLEGCLLAKCLTNIADSHGASSSPKRGGVIEPWERWSLNDFIQVANECGWIHKTRGDFADLLRDYRNLVHPFRASIAGYEVDGSMVSICWQILIASLTDLGFIN
jgi:hypothetical protein